MTNVINLRSGRKKLTPDDIFKNAMKSSPSKMLISTMADDGTVRVWSTDISPQEAWYMIGVVEFSMGSAALSGMNAGEWFEGFES